MSELLNSGFDINKAYDNSLLNIKQIELELKNGPTPELEERLLYFKKISEIYKNHPYYKK
jgi:hypothetical protein